ncbi:hypothetical protein BM221_010511 [Beauveria bassiana]|uniref:Uncharacterized protein n=1 Tax=Beauveria bassiana TaxID=176275 RepID=A0A2N6N817_BEABA|nr:hypothetical protein BM221_010771 [Beauveria bassiana]PMB63769.1 hypothetical protein BM221_010511 [Beauveria bassiana]
MNRNALFHQNRASRASLTLLRRWRGFCTDEVALAIGAAIAAVHAATVALPSAVEAAFVPASRWTMTPAASQARGSQERQRRHAGSDVKLDEASYYQQS